MRRFYIAGKSANTWFQLPFQTRAAYKMRLLQSYGPKCDKRNGSGCGRNFPLDMLSIDHIIPISMGGYVCDLDNMQLLCFKCHKQKTTELDKKGLTFEITSKSARASSECGVGVPNPR